MPALRLPLTGATRGRLNGSEWRAYGTRRNRIGREFRPAGGYYARKPITPLTRAALEHAECANWASEINEENMFLNIRRSAQGRTNRAPSNCTDRQDRSSSH